MLVKYDQVGGVNCKRKHRRGEIARNSRYVEARYVVSESFAENGGTHIGETKFERNKKRGGITIMLGSGISKKRTIEKKAPATKDGGRKLRNKNEGKKE